MQNLGVDPTAPSIVAKAILAYLEFVRSPNGRLVVVVLSLAAFAIIVLWARGGARHERWPSVVAASLMTILVAGIYGIAVAAGWWSGAYFRTPALVQAATLLPVSVVAWTAWLAGYGWLTARTRRPLLIYGMVALLLTLAVGIADRAELSGGLVLVAEDGKTWLNALVGLGMMFVPVLLFEGIRRGLEQDVLP